MNLTQMHSKKCFIKNNNPSSDGTKRESECLTRLIGLTGHATMAQKPLPVVMHSISVTEGHLVFQIANIDITLTCSLCLIGQDTIVHKFCSRYIW